MITGGVINAVSFSYNNGARGAQGGGDGLGVSLLLGVLTVLSEIGGALRQLNIAIGRFSVPHEWYWQWPLLMAPHLVFAHSHAGRVLGLDAFLHQWLAQDPQGHTGLGRFLQRLM